MRGRWRRDGEKDWEETGHEEETSANRKLRPDLQLSERRLAI